MKIILSRKGFDSSSGGVPSPIFPDGRMLSLPIPDKQSPIRYQDIRWHEYDLGSIVSSLTNARIPPSYRAHLDPDLCHQSVARSPGWKPIFGQTGSPQGHLRKYGVQEGDLFLFFGLFQEVTLKSKTLVRDRTSIARHVLWGWLQVGKIIVPEACNKSEYEWALYHPHFHRSYEPNNTLYVARDRVDLPSLTGLAVPAAGIFPLFRHGLQLTASTAASSTEWELPRWMYPGNGRPPLSFHDELSRWQLTDSAAQLNAVCRGQEFILDCDHYPEATGWLGMLLGSCGRTATSH